MQAELIESSTAMDDLVSRLANEKIIAVDTEFFRETNYYPKLALLQIATDTIVACIDPLAFDAREALRKILLKPDIIKVFHSCSQDMEVLFYYLGEIPSSVYDTQLACALLSTHLQIAYATLVESELGVQLDKSQTRTNWLRRPLTDKQIQYAGDDVYYLFQLYHILEKKLHDAGRQSWFEEECRKSSVDEAYFQVDVDRLWKRVKGTAKLNRNKLAIVQSIAQWREKLAQQYDKTRRAILADNIIIQLALTPPTNLSMLGKMINNKFKLDNNEQQKLMASIQSSLQLDEENWPDNSYTQLDQQQKNLLKECQHLINTKAEELNIAPPFLCSRKELEKLILCNDYNDDIALQSQCGKLNIITGWRLHCAGQQLLETLKNSK